MNIDKIFGAGWRTRRRRLILTLFSALCVLCPASRNVLAADREIDFGTHYQERIFRVRDGVFTTRELQDKFPISVQLSLPRVRKFRTMEISSSEFGIHLERGQVLTAYDFMYRDHHVEPMQDGGKKLVVHLEGRAVPLNVTLIYSTEPGKPWMRKELRITPRAANARKYVVEKIDVERIGYIEGEVDGGGIGQPVFLSTRNCFFGLEYPEGRDESAGGVITLSHYPGIAVGEGLESKSAVWGVAPDGQARKEFLEQYVVSFALHSPPEPVVTFRDAWNSGSSPNEAITLQSISILKEKLIDGQGVKVDIYGIDGSGWYDPASILAINQNRFPRGFDPVQKAAEAAGMEIGLWVSITGSDMNSYWGIAHGMEAVRGSETGPYCIAGPKYRAALKTALQQYLDVNRVNGFKFDYNAFVSCQPATGSSSEALSAREAAIDAYIDVLKFVHATRPNATIEITTGMWLSPWWLRYADWVWLGGSDLDFLTASGNASLQENGSTIPSNGDKRASEISYRDSVVWQDLRKQRYAFPAWGLMTHGFYNWVQIGGAPDPEAGVEGTVNCCNEPLSDFADHVVTVLMRGINDWELLLNLHQMTPEKWEYLGRGLKWGRAHWDVLSNTEMILGNPSKYQVYGYTHFRGTHGIISLRNPANSRQNAEVVLDPENGLWNMPPSGLHGRQIYPCEETLPGTYGAGSKIHVTLDAHQTKVIELGEVSHESVKLADHACRR